MRIACHFIPNTLRCYKQRYLIMCIEQHQVENAAPKNTPPPPLDQCKYRKNQFGKHRCLAPKQDEENQTNQRHNDA